MTEEKTNAAEATPTEAGSISDAVRLSGKKRKLYVRFIFIFLTIGILIYLTTAAIGAFRFYTSIVNYYEMIAYDAANATFGYFSKSDMSEWVDTLNAFYDGKVGQEALTAVSESESYKSASELILNLRESIDANDIYVFYLDETTMRQYDDVTSDSKTWKPFRYIIDTNSDEKLIYHYGEDGSMLPKFIPSFEEILSTGKRSKTHIIYSSDFGFNITGIEPITKDGKVIALVAVEMPMRELYSDLVSFILRTSLGALLATIILIAIGTYTVIKRIINPISIVSNEAQVFVDNENKISERLGYIKTGDEIETLSQSLLKMQIGINEYIKDLTVVTAEKERIGTELNVATKIQADMLPRIFPPFPDKKEFDLFASMDPAKEVGGDFYDFFLIDENHLGLVIADVSGKGVPAALFMVIAKTLIKNRAIVGGSPAEILEYANNQLCEGNDQEFFVTVWLGILDISTGKGVAANAGHEHPVIKRADGDFELVVYRHSLALAVMEDVPFQEHEFELNPGDTLLVYTDGVPEATNSNDVQYGTDRMLRLLNRNKNASMDELLKALRKDVDIFVGNAPQFDDLTMLALKYNGNTAE